MLKHRMSDKENPIRKKNYKMTLGYKYRKFKLLYHNTQYFSFDVDK